MHKHSNILMNTGGSLSQTESMAGDIAMKSLEGGMLYKCIVLIYRVCIKINRFQPYLGLFHLGTGPWTCESKHMCCRHSLSVFFVAACSPQQLLVHTQITYSHKIRMHRWHCIMASFQNLKELQRPSTDLKSYPRSKKTFGHKLRSQVHGPR